MTPNNTDTAVVAIEPGQFTILLSTNDPRVVHGLLQETPDVDPFSHLTDAEFATVLGFIGSQLDAADDDAADPEADLRRGVSVLVKEAARRLR